MSKRYIIETFGCQMNVHDSERMAGLLEAQGYVRAEGDEDADVIVINTCSVREKAEEKLFHRLAEIRYHSRLQHRDPIVAVTGCVAQQEGARIAERSDLVDVIVGTQALKQLPDLVRSAEARLEGRALVDTRAYEDVSFPLGLPRREDPVRAYVTIIEGCNEFCAFCVVPYTRGHERMRPVADILREVEHAAATGHPEVQLLGQIVNHYQAPDDPACDFATLLERVSEIPGISRIRFASPHPRHVTPRMIESMARLPKVCRHLHLPVQSGSNRVLAAMRRRHTREDYLNTIASLRSAIPGVQVSTDIIVGFPGESEDDFAQTMDLVERVGYNSIFSFKYSTRPNTLASKRMPDDVSEAEKTRRIVALQALQRERQLHLHESMVGSDVEVLVDGPSKRRPSELAGRTSTNVVVNFAGPLSLVGTLTQVRIVRAGPHSVAGEVGGASEHRKKFLPIGGR